MYDYELQKALLLEHIEKSKLRRAVWCLAIPCAVFYFVTLFWGQAAISFLALFGINAQKAITVLNDAGILQIVSIVLSLFLMTVPFAICCNIADCKVSQIGGFKRAKSGTALPYYLFGIGFCAFANIAVNVASEIFESFGFHYSMPHDKNPDGVFGFLLVIISTVLVPALVEEFAFRGIVLGLLRPFGEGFAIICSSVVFGLLHGNFEQIPFAFLVGLILSLIRIKTDSLLVCMAVHATNNLISVLASYSSGMPAVLSNLVYTVYILFALVLSVLALSLLKGKDGFVLNKYSGVLKPAKLYRGFFLSPAIIILAVLFLLRAVTYLAV